MKHSRWIHLLLICTAILLCVVPAYCDQTDSSTQSITVVGTAGITNGNNDAAKNSAIADACRNAVKQGISVWIRSNSTMQNSSAINDQILQHAAGYVTSYDIIKEGADGGIYSVTMRADVAVDQIGVDFKKLVGVVKTQMGNPSVAFVLTTWEMKGSQGSSSTTTNVASSSKNHETGTYNTSDDEKNFGTVNNSVVATDKGGSQASSMENNKASVSETDKSAINGTIKDSGSDSASAKVSAVAHETNNSASIAVNAQDKYSSNETLQGKVTTTDSADVKASAENHSASKYNDTAEATVQGSINETNGSKAAGASDKTNTSETSTQEKKDSSYFNISEDVWKKYPDPQIIDAFQQEFKEKGFDIMAADQARAIALTESLAGTSVNLNDRKAVREFAQKDGANFVARGEVRVLSIQQSASTGNYDSTAQIGVEIIDVNSGDVVASYSNTVTASNPTQLEAKAQSILKAAVVAARRLAGQTIDTWQDRSQNGNQFTIEVHNIKSIRSQQRPFINIIQSCAQVTNEVNPTEGVLMIRVLYKGNKEKLENDILDKLDGKPGFSEQEFDGPKDNGGNIYFEFKK